MWVWPAVSVCISTRCEFGRRCRHLSSENCVQILSSLSANRYWLLSICLCCLPPFLYSDCFLSSLANSLPKKFSLWPTPAQAGKSEEAATPSCAPQLGTVPWPSQAAATSYLLLFHEIASFPGFKGESDFLLLIWPTVTFPFWLLDSVVTCSNFSLSKYPWWHLFLSVLQVMQAHYCLSLLKKKKVYMEK